MPKNKLKLYKTRHGRESNGQPLTLAMKKKKRKYLVEQCDILFSRKIKKRDSNKFGIIQCPLCNHKLKYDSKQCHNMHFIKRGIWKYRRLEINCHAGCLKCNVMLHGNYDVYDIWIRDHLGEEKYWELKDYQCECRKNPYLNKKPSIEELEVLYNQLKCE